MTSHSENILFSLQTFLEKYSEIIIPALQRDYVMGSSSDIFTRLKKDIRQKKYSTAADFEFDFGCIVGCRDTIDGNRFYVYDGQQRIVTLVFLTAYILSQHVKYKNNVSLKQPYAKLLKRFKFENRDAANTFLDRILANDMPAKKDADDLTSHTIINLLANSHDLYLEPDDLFKKVKFKIEEVGEKSFAEQLFLDLNEGVPLKNYEIFKSELHYCVNELLGLPENCGNPMLLNFSNQMDNKWLDWFFLHFSDRCPLDKVEEAEMRVILFIIKMTHLEKAAAKKNAERNYHALSKDLIALSHFDTVNLAGLLTLCDMATLTKIYTLMENLTSITIETASRVKENLDFYVIDGATCYLNLQFNHYPAFVFSTVWCLLFPKCEHRFLDECMFWCYLCTLQAPKRNQNAYLRLIKKLLNHNRYEDNNLRYYTDAYYTDKVYYGRYKVIGAENYYKNVFDAFDPFKVNETGLKRFLCAYTLDTLHFNALAARTVSDLTIMGLINVAAYNHFSDTFSDKLSEESQKYLSYPFCKDIILYENDPFFNGLIYNMLVATGQPTSPFAVIIPYSNYKEGMLKIRKQNKADTLLGRLQSYSKDFLLLPTICRWSNNSQEAYASFSSTVDLMTCTDKKISDLLRKSWHTIFATENDYGQGRYAWVSAYLQHVDSDTGKMIFKGKYFYSNNQNIKYYTLFSYSDGEVKFAFVPHSQERPRILLSKTDLITFRYNTVSYSSDFDDTTKQKILAFLTAQEQRL